MAIASVSNVGTGLGAGAWRIVGKTGLSRKLQHQPRRYEGIRASDLEALLNTWRSISRAWGMSQLADKEGLCDS